VAVGGKVTAVPAVAAAAAKLVVKAPMVPAALARPAVAVAVAQTQLALAETPLGALVAAVLMVAPATDRAEAAPAGPAVLATEDCRP
jgi:hypothetical protein